MNWVSRLYVSPYSLGFLQTSFRLVFFRAPASKIVLARAAIAAVHLPEFNVLGIDPKLGVNSSQTCSCATKRRVRKATLRTITHNT